LYAGALVPDQRVFKRMHGADAGVVHGSDRVLGAHMALFGCLHEPCEGFRITLLHASADSIHVAETVLRVRQSLRRRLRIPVGCLFD
jgi:hypothetical protein